MEYVHRRFFQLLLPYLIWAFISWLIEGCFSFSGLINIFLYPDNYLWFLWALFFICIIFRSTIELAVIFRINENVLIIITSMILTSVMLLLNVRVMGFQYISYYYLFYAIGYMINKYNIVTSNKYLIFILLLVFSMLAWHWRMHSLPSLIIVPSSSISSILLSIYRIITAGIAVLALISLFKFASPTSVLLYKLVSSLGTISLGIYAIHLQIVFFIVDILRRALTSYWLIIIISTVLTLMMSVGMVLLLKKNTLAKKLLLGQI